ncbi:hypothetical protein BVU76_23575 [Mycolicibacterium porcinum]|nr:hypothetical protein BVU76_23575 [Mycolicibacterium porcinum]
MLLVEDGNHGEYRPRPDEFVSDGVPFIRAADMSSGVIDFANAGRINATARERIRKGIGAPGDVILSHKGTVGRVAVAPARSPDFVCSPQTTFWRSLDPRVVDQRFLRYVMVSADFARQLDVLKGQTDMAPYVSLTDQRSMEIELPDISHQRAIADVLGALDDKIAANERVVSLARDLANARFFHAAHDGLEIRVADAAVLLSRGVSPKYVERDGMTVLNQKCVRDQRVSLTPARLMTPLSTRMDRLLRKNDVLVNSTGAGTLGRVARWTNTAEATVDSHITIVRFDDAVVDPVCAGFALVRLQSAIEALAEGSTGQTELRRDLLGGLTLVVPARGAQSKLGEELDTLDALQQSVLSESATVARIRDELLPLLMSGKLPVKDAENLVAEAL